MGVMANLPILLVRDDKIGIGVFDKVISEYKIKTLSSATPLANIETNDEFRKWLSMFTDASDEIKLTDEMIILAEHLAENAHNTWAKELMSQGWIYGKTPDDKLKHHPRLVSYEKLSEAEKEAGRNIYIETLKTIIKLGFNIEK